MVKKYRFSSLLALITAMLIALNMITVVPAANAILQIRNPDRTPKSELKIAPTEKADADMERPTWRPIGEPGVAVQDADTRWRRRTEVEIFHASYNETGEITVNSDNGDSLVAPGTENRYYFDIINVGTTGARYWLEVESASAEVTYNGETREIPVEVRFSQYRGRYLTGSEDTWEPLTALNGERDRRDLSSGHYARYILDWRWPFESGDDGFDTYLGDQAVFEDLTVSITFRIIAEADDEYSGGNPKTGDDSHIGLWVTVMAITATLMILLLIFYIRDNRNDKEDTKEENRNNETTQQ